MGWAAGVRTATLIVVLGTLAAAWHPTTSTPSGSDAGAVRRLPPPRWNPDDLLPVALPGAGRDRAAAPTF